MAKNKNQAFITNRESKGNSFGDRTFSITAVILDSNGEQTLAEKTFQEIAQEGEHSHVRRLMTMEIKSWAKENNATFTGSV